METVIVNSIQYSLNNFLYANAVFMAERLLAHEKNDLSLQLLATAYLASGKPNQAHALLKDSTSVINKYLFALSAFKLDRLDEAERALIGETHHFIPQNVPNGAAGLYLLGLISKKQPNQMERAKKCFIECLRINPLMWSAYESLANMGANIDPAEFFGTEVSMPSISSNTPLTIDPPVEVQSAKEIIRPRNEKKLLSTPQIAKKIFNSTHVSPYFEDIEESSFALKVNPVLDQMGKKFKDKGSGLASPFVASAKPKVPVTGTVETSSVNLVPLEAEVPRKQSNSQSSRGQSTVTPSTATKPRVSHGEETHVNSKTSLMDKNTKQPKSITMKKPEAQSQDTKKEALEIPKNKDHNISIVETNENNSVISKDTEASNEKLFSGTVEVLNLLRTLGQGLRLLNKYACKEAIAVFSQLASNQYKTGWVLCHVARSYFEMVQYTQARKIFQEVRSMEPYRTSFMELYSTILWHLKDEYELSHLAQELTQFDRNCAATWCVVGNCFSLQKEHETSLKFLKRAIQIDPDFTYAYTLTGHEFISSENWEKATTNFKNAIRLDPRHYNAWYGLGQIYYSQEKYTQAEYHFKKALEINPNSSVLYCYVGMVLNEQKNPKEALNMLSKALSIDPKNSLAQFKKASVLFSLDLYDDALKELKQLKERTPKEAPIYFLMGKIYKRKNKIHKAMTCLTTALDFDQKSANYIKSAINRLGSSDNESEEEDFGDLQ